MTKNMEDLLWRGDSLDRAPSLLQILDSRLTSCRHVPSLYIPTGRVGQVPESGSSNQSRGSATKMGAGGRHRLCLYRFHMVEILLIDPNS